MPDRASEESLITFLLETLRHIGSGASSFLLMQALRGAGMQRLRSASLIIKACLVMTGDERELRTGWCQMLRWRSV
jgi:hypothetical protein